MMTRFPPQLAEGVAQTETKPEILSGGEVLSEISSDQQGQKEGHHIRDYQVLHHRGDHVPETKASGRVRHSLCY